MNIFFFKISFYELVTSFDLQVAYTFDAGPNAVLIARNRNTATLLIQRLLYYFPPNSDNLSRYILSEVFQAVCLLFYNYSYLHLDF